jgi:ATP-dependent helicase/nuclease subunit B
VRGLDQAAAVVPVRRPKPTPPVALRPTTLSVTQIETLRRDPYAIYASHILRLVPLPRADDGYDPRQFGTALHDALHRFCQVPAASGTPAERQHALRSLLEKTFETSLADPDFATFRWPIVLKAATVFLTFDAEQRRTVRDVMTERSGRLDLTLTDETMFVLRARADRIDMHRDGSATLIDYKTGQVPGVNEVKVGFAPQLTLEAAILTAGGFDVPHRGATGATYLKLGGRDGGLVRPLEFEDATFDDVVERHVKGLVRLLSSLRHADVGYPSRPFPKYAKAYDDYDHLARVREWSLAGDDEIPA